jgi:phosphocarrier protein HPr
VPSTRVIIGSSVGLHARPAGLLVEAAREHPGSVRIGRDENGLVDAESILAVMSLGVGPGEEVLVVTEGGGAQEALDRIAALLASDLDSADHAGQGPAA